jgi:hypothetical protein
MERIAIGFAALVVAILWGPAGGPASAAEPAGATPAAKGAAEVKAPENLARKAIATASSEYSQDYAASKAIDGLIPAPMGKADVGKAWAAKGAHHPDGVTFTLDWPVPITIAEIVYYGRTGWLWTENWKDYEAYLDRDPAPIVKGRLECGHGPQRVRLPGPRQAMRVRLKFLSHWGGQNIGAAEIQVYAETPPEGALGKFEAAAPPAADGPPPAVAAAVKESPELAAKLKAGDLGFTRLVVAQRHLVRCSHVYTYHCEGQKDGGGLYVYDVAAGRLEQLVDSAGGQVLSLDLSWDGRTVVFAWRKGRHYHLYRIGADGTGLVQLTDGEHDNFDPCWLPDGGIALLSTRSPCFAYCWTTEAGILHRMKGDGSEVRRISWNYLNDFTPAVLEDGRLIYGRWEYVDRPAIPIQSLWTINPDGTAMAGFFGNRALDPATFIEAQPIPGRPGQVLCTLTGHNGQVRGAIGILDPAVGNNAQAAIRNLTPEVRLRGVNTSSNGPQGPYQTPFPIDDRYYLVSKDGTLLVRDYEARQEALVLGPEGGLGFYNPRPLRPRPRPPVRASSLPDPEKAGPWATVYLQDVYNGLGPSVARGEVRQICVVQELSKSRVGHSTGFGFQRPVVSCGATYIPKKVWGFAPVGEDGSAYFRVPATAPIYFIALDAQGRGIQRMRSFTHLMPGEVQGCIGCHESRTESPRPLRPVATDRKPVDLVPPDYGVRGFDYASIVQPVLDRHCLKCHNGKSAPNGVDLSGDRTAWFNVSYDVLAHEGGDLRRGGNRYTNWISTMNGAEANILEIEPKTWGSPKSRLADLVLSGHPDADGKPRANLPPDDRQRVLTWIDVNVPYYGTSLTSHPKFRGGRFLEVSELGKVLADVAARRCSECHKGGKLPKGNRLRITNPQNNSFLLAPLARGAGGTQACGQAVFEDTDDPDYQAILGVFGPILGLLEKDPRADLAGARDSGAIRSPNVRAGAE